MCIRDRPPSSHESPTRFGTQHISPVSHQSQTPSEVFTSTHRPSEVFIGFHTGNLAAGISSPEISITGTDKSPRDISYLPDMSASSDMASASYWPPHLTGTNPTSSLEAQYGSRGTRSFESPVISAQMHVDDVLISNVQRVDDVSVHDVYLTDYLDVADRPASFARDTPASRMTAGTRTVCLLYTSPSPRD